MENLYTSDKSKKLDPRAVFIIQGSNDCPLYIWKGANVPPGNVAVYEKEAQRYAQILQQNEKASSKIVNVEQGQEDDQFWQMFFKNQQVPPTNKLYGNVVEWDRLLIDLEKVGNFVKAAPVVNQMKDYRDIVSEEQKMKPKLYTYPNWNESSTVFDFEELTEENLLVLCVRAQHNIPGHEHDSHKVYIWKGMEFDEEEANNEVISIQEFQNRVMEQYWGCKNPQDQFNIEILYEFSQKESDEFNEFF